MGCGGVGGVATGREKEELCCAYGRTTIRGS